MCASDDRLLCDVAEALRICNPVGQPAKLIPLPGYRWARVCPDAGERTAVHANVWTGKAVRIDIDKDKIVQLVDSGFMAPFRSLAGLAVFDPRAAALRLLMMPGAI